MARLPDWETRLGAYLTAMRDRPYRLGDHDCALFVAGGIEAVTGSDLAAPFRGRYRNELTAAKALQGAGVETLDELVDRHLEPIPTSFAGRGDVVAVASALGICIGGEAIFVGQEADRPGLVRLPRSTWTKAWRV